MHRYGQTTCTAYRPTALSCAPLLDQSLLQGLTLPTARMVCAAHQTLRSCAARDALTRRPPRFGAVQPRNRTEVRIQLAPPVEFEPSRSLAAFTRSLYWLVIFERPLNERSDARLRRLVQPALRQHASLHHEWMIPCLRSTDFAAFDHCGVPVLCFFPGAIAFIPFRDRDGDRSRVCQRIAWNARLGHLTRLTHARACLRKVAGRSPGCPRYRESPHTNRRREYPSVRRAPCLPLPSPSSEPGECPSLQ